jgi:hypothetical protein
MDDPTVEDVIKMPLAEFEGRFGFRPVDALEKKHFAVTGNRPDQFIRDAIAAGVIGETNLDGVVMD